MKELEVNKVLPVINANFEEVKESLNQSLEKYKGIVVTEETLQDCKKTQQDLGKVEKGIEDFRKSVKKDMESPIKEFEAKCKELTALIGEVKKPIKEGIVLYDTKRKEEKKKQAEEIIKECIITLALSEKYSRQLTVLDKYTNLSASKKSIVEDVQARGQALFTDANGQLDGTVGSGRKITGEYCVQVPQGQTGLELEFNSSLINNQQIIVSLN